MPIAVCGFLLALGGMRILRARKKVLVAEHFFLIYWLWGIVAISIMGAVPMNNSWLWPIIGAALALAGPKTRLLWPRAHDFVAASTCGTRIPQG